MRWPASSRCCTTTHVSLPRIQIESSADWILFSQPTEYIVTRVEEEHLWECKQLGAHSPHVLLSTLMFFNTKHFNLTVSLWVRPPPTDKLKQSDFHSTECWGTHATILLAHYETLETKSESRFEQGSWLEECPASILSTANCIRFVLVARLEESPILIHYSLSETNARKKKVYEQQENEENPLRCPVKLYEFYLSKWWVLPQVVPCWISHWLVDFSTFSVRKALRPAMTYSICCPNGLAFPTRRFGIPHKPLARKLWQRCCIASKWSRK